MSFYFPDKSHKKRESWKVLTLCGYSSRLWSLCLQRYSTRTLYNNKQKKQTKHSFEVGKNFVMGKQHENREWFWKTKTKLRRKQEKINSMAGILTLYNIICVLDYHFNTANTTKISIIILLVKRTVIICIHFYNGTLEINSVINESV